MVMNRDKISKQEFDEMDLPDSVRINGHYTRIIWTHHREGTLSFCSYRHSKRNIENLAKEPQF